MRRKHKAALATGTPIIISQFQEEQLQARQAVMVRRVAKKREKPQKNCQKRFFQPETKRIQLLENMLQAKQTEIYSKVTESFSGLNKLFIFQTNSDRVQ